MDTGSDCPSSDKDCGKLEMPDGDSRRQSDKPTAEEVTQKPGKLKSPDQVPVFKTQTFPKELSGSPGQPPRWRIIGWMSGLVVHAL